MPPDSVAVQPLFFVPADQSAPTRGQIADYAAHLAWAQQRYGELLGGVTFAITGEPAVVGGAQPLSWYRSQPEEGIPAITAELLALHGETRWTNPYAFLAIVIDPEEYGGARPVNGGFTGGGAIGVISSAAFLGSHFQSTLQHELGHAFGLPHVDVYGDDMATSPSIMSYNVAHWTSGFQPSLTPGVFVGEDLRGLAFNDRALDGYVFTTGSALSPVVCLGPMELPGHPPAVIDAATSAGELFGTSVENVVHADRIAPSEGPGVTFDATTMWQSDTLPDGWAEVELTFPTEVTLDGIGVHTQHSGQYHAATAARVDADRGDGFEEVGGKDALAIDEVVSFDATTATAWRVRLEAGESGMVTVRGFRFFIEGVEVFPRCVPHGG